ncbi:MAG TPA: glycosyltransferase family 9 protein [Pyrinomonadaceae bacterium]|nr:glycosyltransferase family 9 protein [Pyrinomonadaceae bacterium]
MSLFPDYGPNENIDRPWLDAKRILYLNHHGLGDSISASASLKSLRDAFPSAYLAATFISEPIAQLFSATELIDEYLIYRSGLTNFHAVDKRWHVFGSLSGMAKFLIRIRQLHFDLILGADNINPKLLVALGKLAGIRWIIGECPKGSKASRFFARYVEHKLPHLPHIQASLAILHGAGIPVSCAQPFIPLNDDDRQFASDWLLEKGFQREKGFAVIHVATGWKRDQKRWPLEKFGELGKWLFEDLDMRVVFVGTPDERGIIDQTINSSGFDGVNAGGGFSVRQTAAIVERASVVVGNDSGIVHLGGALGRPTVAIYGPTDANRARPYGKQVRTIWNQMPCSPCDSVLPFGCGLPVCIQDVQVAQVKQAVVEVMGN